MYYCSSEVTVQVVAKGNVANFCVDRIKLSSASPRLREMVNSRIKDRIILYTTERAFRIFLKFIDKANYHVMSVEEAVETCSFAHEYDVKLLKTFCEEFISSNLTTSNACYIYYHAKQMGLSVSKKCQELFCLETKDVINSEAFKNSDISIVEAIVKCEKLTVQREVDLFTALVQWAKLECIRRGDKLTKENLRFNLRVLLPHVRFLDMSVKEFVDVVATSQILNESEQRTFLINIINPNIGEIPEGFCHVRCSRVSEMQYVNLYRRETKDCGKLTENTEFCSTIKVNRGAIQICRLYFPFMEKMFTLVPGTAFVKMKVSDANDVVKYMSVFEEGFTTEGEDCFVHCHSATVKEGETLLISAKVSGCRIPIPVFKCTFYGYSETVGTAQILALYETGKALNFKKISMFCKSPIYL